MIELRYIRHLIAAATYPTVQDAADAVHITQPALTKSIARFEEELEAKLFERRGRRLVLTELGHRMVRRGEELLRHVQELEEEVALWKNIGTGEVSIGVDAEVELGLLPRVLEVFVPAHSGVKVMVRSGHTEALLPALVAGELHFLVADPEVAYELADLEIRELAADPIAAAVRPNHPLAESPDISPHAMMSHPVAGAFTAPRYSHFTAKESRMEGIKPLQPSLISDNYEVLVRLAATSDTIVIGPRHLLESYQATGVVKVMPWDLHGPLTNPSLIHSKGRYFSPAAERLIELFEQFAGRA